MTIHEFTRCIPLGSAIRIYPSAKSSGAAATGPETGVVVACNYPDNRIQLQARDGSARFHHLGDIAYVEILRLPPDFGSGESGVSVSEATRHLLARIDCNPADINQYRLSLKDDFSSASAPLVQVLESEGLTTAANQIRSLVNNSNTYPMPESQWEAMFQDLTLAREAAESRNLPSAPDLCRAEALLNIFAAKKAGLDALRYGASLVVDSLIRSGVKVLPPDAYSSRLADERAALDWFLLANVYLKCHMQNECAYVALLQSVICRGRLFDNHTNRKVFCLLCGDAHDFTFMKQILGRWSDKDGLLRDEYPRDHLMDMGRLMCWMLYQMGGQGALDSFELLAPVTAESHTNGQLQDLHERMLLYAHKYAPRNRNDRFTAISRSMALLLEAAATGYPMIPENWEYGYIYEFHGACGVYHGEFTGHILGINLIPYRFSYSAESYDLSVPRELQNIYLNASEEINHRLVSVLFQELLPGSKKSRLQAVNLKPQAGGVIDL